MQVSALLIAALVAATPARATLVNKIVATVDGEPITLYELKDYGQKSLRGRQLSSSGDQAALLESLITDKVIEKEASDKGVIVRDEDIDRYIEGIKERNKLDDEQLRQALSAQGLTWEGYRKQIREEIEKAQLISREIQGKVSVTPEEVERYYQAHLDEYSTPGRIRIAHILFPLAPDAPPEQVAAVTAEAEQVRKQIEDGADFGEMAKRYSHDASAESGGDLGWFKEGAMLDEIEAAAKHLEVGEVSPPVRTHAGVHLVKLEGREGASHEQLDQLADQIKKQLYNAALEERFDKWLTEELRKRHHVEILE
jgi:peptidyl-prolyl cis-trans isomerase SurA